MMNRPLLNVGYVGLLVILVSIVLVAVFPSQAPRLPDGFFTPIIAFEFIETRAEVFQMFVDTSGTVRHEMVAAMNLGNRLDFIYMVLYNLFLALFCAKCAAISRKKFYYAGSVIAVAVLAADALENVQLLGITGALETRDFGCYLEWLRLFTWVKWGGICAVFLVLVFWFKNGGRFSRIIALNAILTAMAGLAAFFHRSVLNEFFSLGVVVMFLMMIIYCFVYKSHDEKLNDAD